MKRGLLYLLYALVFWVSAQGVNYISYSISDNAIDDRDFVDLSIERAEIPVSSVKDTDVSLVSFQQRGLNDEKKTFQKSFLAELKSTVFSDLYLSSFSGYFSNNNHCFYILPPNEFLTHQWLI